MIDKNKSNFVVFTFIFTPICRVGFKQVTFSNSVNCFQNWISG